MKRWIKVEIEVDEKIGCDACYFVEYDKISLGLYCPIFDKVLDGTTRCKACIGADTTDKLNAIDVLIDVLSEMLNNKIKPEMDVLKKRNAVLERAMKIMEESSRGKSLRICNYAIEQAQQEIESEDGDVSKR